ncbi:MAG: hypothetical protein A2580_13330 [Hydrogenophilales bacterium RIFOXYD1_FULL_62_11]|nr:MAG: hypothetical protein A2580_13330 [Hydrogenophilales bacterium RIFOXYD1_FULL_62_11]
MNAQPSSTRAHEALSLLSQTLGTNRRISYGASCLTLHYAWTDTPNVVALLEQAGATVVANIPFPRLNAAPTASTIMGRICGLRFVGRHVVTAGSSSMEIHLFTPDGNEDDPVHRLNEVHAMADALFAGDEGVAALTSYIARRLQSQPGAGHLASRLSSVVADYLAGQAPVYDLRAAQQAGSTTR